MSGEKHVTFQKEEPKELSIDETFEIIDAFKEPIVDQKWFQDQRIDLVMYKDLMEERNVNCEICAWGSCPNSIVPPEVYEKPIYCCRKCEFLSQQFMKSITPRLQDPIGSIIEKSPQTNPPIPLCSVKSDAIDGYRVRVGPYHEILDHIESWFGGFPISIFQGLNKAQEEIFQLVNKNLRTIDIELKKTELIISYFVNINVDNPSIVSNAPEPFPLAFSLAIYYVLFESEFTGFLHNHNISQSLFNDLVEIVSQGMGDESESENEDDDWFS